MSKKIPLGIVIALLLIAIAGSGLFSAYFVVNNNNKLLVDLPARAEQYANLSDIEELVRSEYFGQIDSQTIGQSLANGFLSGLDDSFCYYIAADDFDDYSNLIKGKMSGVGLSVYYENTTDNLVIANIANDSPAATTALQNGYQIVTVDGKNVTEKNCQELIARLCDTFDGKVKFTYLKNAEDKKEKPVEIELQLGYNSKTCFSSVENGIGYIRINSFYETTVSEFRDSLNSLLDSGTSDVVIDLRNSSGANLDIAAEVIDMIVPVGSEGTGAIFTAKNSSGEIVKQASSDAESVTADFAVLVNENTACAAELLACDLRDFGKAVIIGERTSGHGTLQELFTLEDGSAITLTVAEIIPYASDSFNNVGIEPDLLVEVADGFYSQIGVGSLSEDAQFLAASSVLKAK